MRLHFHFHSHSHFHSNLSSLSRNSPPPLMREAGNSNPQSPHLPLTLLPIHFLPRRSNSKNSPPFAIDTFYTSTSIFRHAQSPKCALRQGSYATPENHSRKREEKIPQASCILHDGRVRMGKSRLSRANPPVQKSLKCLQ